MARQRRRVRVRDAPRLSGGGIGVLPRLHRDLVRNQGAAVRREHV